MGPSRVGRPTCGEGTHLTSTKCKTGKGKQHQARHRVSAQKRAQEQSHSLDDGHSQEVQIVFKIFEGTRNLDRGSREHRAQGMIMKGHGGLFEELGGAVGEMSASTGDLLAKYSAGFWKLEDINIHIIGVAIGSGHYDP